MNRYKNNFYCKFSQLHVQVPYKSMNSDFCSKHASGGEKCVCVWGGGVTRKKKEKNVKIITRRQVSPNKIEGIKISLLLTPFD